MYENFGMSEILGILSGILGILKFWDFGDPRPRGILALKIQGSQGFWRPQNFKDSGNFGDFGNSGILEILKKLLGFGGFWRRNSEDFGDGISRILEAEFRGMWRLNFEDSGGEISRTLGTEFRGFWKRNSV
jgi:hypothetical protein